MYQIVKDSHQVLKEFPTKEQCVIWCYEHKLVYDCFEDFGDEGSGKFTMGVTIREVRGDKDSAIGVGE